MRTKLAGLLSCMVLVVVQAAPAAAQGSGVEVRWTGRAQIQFNTTSVKEEDVAAVGTPASIAASTFETRRIRVAARLTIDEWITGLIEPDFALGKLALKQVWMNLGIDPAFQLRIGQYKKPFSHLLLTSSTEYATIERGLRIRELDAAYEKADEDAASQLLSKFNGDVVLGEEQELLELFGYMGYELGASAHGQLGAFDYEVGLFNGSGADSRDNNDGKSYAGKLRWNAPTEMPLSVGGAFSYHETRASAAAPTVDGSAFELDIEVGDFRREGIHLLGEAVTGRNLAVDETFIAAQAVASYFRPKSGRVEGIEPTIRVSWGDPNREMEDDAGMLFTPGVTLYFMGRNRLMLNWDAYMPQSDRFDTHYALRAQAQLAF